MIIDNKQWSNWVVALGIELANITSENEMRFKVHTIQLGMEKIIDELDRQRKVK